MLIRVYHIETSPPASRRSADVGPRLALDRRVNHGKSCQHRADVGKRSCQRVIEHLQDVVPISSQCNVDVGTTYSRRRQCVAGRRIKIGRPSATALALHWPLRRPRRWHDVGTTLARRWHDVGTTSATDLSSIGSTSVRRRPRSSSIGHRLTLHLSPTQCRWHCLGDRCSAGEVPVGQCSHLCGYQSPQKS